MAQNFLSDIKLGDSIYIRLGSRGPASGGGDLNLSHNGTNSFIDNHTGQLYIRNFSDDKNIHLQSDDGSGGMTDYIVVHGSENIVKFQEHSRHLDNKEARFGTGSDLKIYHESSTGHSHIKEAGTGELRLSANIFRVLNANSSETMIYAEQDGKVQLRFNESTKFETTSAGINVTGTVTLDNVASIQGTDTGNPQANTDELRVSGYGVMGRRGTVYVTNSDPSGSVQIGVSGSHNSNPKLVINASNSLFYTNVRPNADSTYDLGSSSYYWANAYIDAITTTGNVTVGGSLSSGDITVEDATPVLVLKDNNNGAGGAAHARVLFSNTGGKAIGIGTTGDDDTSTDLYISSNAGSTYGGYLSLDSAGISDAQADIIIDPKTNFKVFTAGTLALTLDTSQNANFQNVALFNDNKGINFGNSNAKIYGSSADGIKFNAGGSEAMRLNQSGNLGIGTDSPDDPLHILGSANGNVNLRIENSNTGTNAYASLRFENDSIDTGVLFLNSSNNTQYGGANSLNLYQGGNHTIGFNTNNLLRMAIKGNGNVGVGTNSPQAALHVAGAFNSTSPTGNGVLMGYYLNAYGYIQLNGTSGGYIDFSTSGTDHKGRILYDNTNNYLRLDTDGAERMRITSGGKVGIDVQNPDAELQVGPNQNAAATGISFAAGSSVGNLIARTTTHHNWLPYSDGNNYYSAGEHTFRNGSHGTDYMKIKSSGNVGIGVTDPEARLEVAGGSGLIVDVTNNTYGGLKIDDDSSGDYNVYFRQGRGGANSGFRWYRNARPNGGGAWGTGTHMMSLTTTGLGIGTTTPNTFLHVAGQGNRVGGNIHLGNENDGAGKYGLITSAHYNAATEPEGFSLIGGYSDATTNQVHIGGMIWETNPATQISFWTHSATTHAQGGTERMRIASNGTITFNAYTTAGLLQVNSSGVISTDTNTYLTTSSASSTYVPKSGGSTLSGGVYNINTNTNTNTLNISRGGGNTSEVMKIGIQDTIATFNYIEDTSNEGNGNFGQYRFILSGNDGETSVNALILAKTNATFPDGVRVDNGDLILGEDAFSVSADYVGMKTSHQSGTNDYMIISGTSDGSTYVSAKDGGSVHIRGGANSSTHELQVSSTGATFKGNLQVNGNLNIVGNSSVVNVEDLNVEQGEITLNYNASSNTSGSADGSGIRIQDAVNATTDATMLWNATDDRFVFSNTIQAPGLRSTTANTFTGGMSSFETTLTNNDDWQNSPISILERANIGTGSADDKYSPNLNFHWSGRVSRSLWMDASGNLNYGEYDATGSPGYSNGILRVQEMHASVFKDKDSTGYYLDPANTTTSLNVAGSATFAGDVTGEGGNMTVKNTGTGNAYLRAYATGTGAAGLYIDAVNGDAAGSDYFSLRQLDNKGIEFNARTGTGVTTFYSKGSLNLTQDGANSTFAGSITVNSNGLLSAASTTSATTTTTIASVAIATYTAAFFDYSIKNGTNVRAGTVVATHDGTNVEFNETSTVDLGDTSDVTLSVDISSGDMRLRATTTSSTWTIKALIRGI